MRRQIDHVRLQWPGFKAPTSATRPILRNRIVLGRCIDISRPAQPVSSPRFHFRIRRNQKWPSPALAFGPMRVGPSLHAQQMTLRSRRERCDVSYQQPCRPRQRKKPGVRQPQRAAHSRLQAWQRPYPQPHCAVWISASRAATTAGIGEGGAAAPAAPGTKTAAASTRPRARESFINM
jgi:hypothetical protein